MSTRFCGSGESVVMWNQETSGDAEDEEKGLSRGEEGDSGWGQGISHGWE